ncbi:hypothetical protein GCM10007901_20830 [Dyella acidisoli]|uniref:Uncharacterized protein n=1 Tax=Dyella acidisoli TaxID=1867834 RepID=A0ABQ5XP35_9GAMM|nr:hypothetical protein GCM10007901_20830 [Dyella acidisoli]
MGKTAQYGPVFSRKRVGMERGGPTDLLPLPSEEKIEVKGQSCESGASEFASMLFYRKIVPSPGPSPQGERGGSYHFSS